MKDCSCLRVHQPAATGKKEWRRWLHGTFPPRSDQQDPYAGRCRRPSRHPAPAGGSDCRLQGGRSLDRHSRRGGILLVDRGCDSDAICAREKQRKAWDNIPPKGKPQGRIRLFGMALPPAKHGRALLQPHQIFPRHRNEMRQGPGNSLAAIKLGAARLRCQP